MPKKFGFFMAAAVFVLAVVLGACSGEGVYGDGSSNTNGGRAGGGGSSNPVDGSDEGGDEDVDGGDEGEDGDGDTPVNALRLDDLVVAPVAGEEPDTTAIETEQYTGTIVWQNADGDFNGNFVVGVVYTAVLTLTANPGFTFDGVAANSFVYNGAIEVTNAANSETVTVTISFLATVLLDEVGEYLDNASDGTDAAPIPLPVQIDIATDWGTLLGTIQSKEKYVALDLSGCTMSGTTFDPGAANTGKGYIVSLVLPDDATSIKGDETWQDSTFEGFSALKSVSGKNVQTVGDYAFENCSSLTTVDLPAATSIGEDVFEGTGLTRIEIPATLTSISDGAFGNCTSLSEFTVAPGNPNYMTSNDKKMLLSRDGKLIAYPTAAGEVTLDAEITTIGRTAFYGCTNLTKVNLQKATSIGDSAFENCSSLVEVTLPEATSIGNRAFLNCTSLTTVSLQAATSIGERAFYGCSKLETVDLQAATSIGEHAFENCSSLVKVTLPEATSIGLNAFLNCTSLTTVSLPEATSIGISAFGGCTSLVEVSLPKATSIGDCAFQLCSSLKKVTLPANAPTLGVNIFQWITDKTVVTVLVPEGTSYNENWKDGFRGRGWDGSVNTNISLEFQYLSVGG